MEFVRIFEVVAQLGTNRHSPHEVRGDFLMADLSFPEHRMFQSKQRARLNKLTAHVSLCVSQQCDRERPRFREQLPLPVSFVSAEGEGEVSRYLLKVLQ